MVVINIILAILFAYFLFYILYFLIYALAGRIAGIKSRMYGHHADKGKFLVLIPAYKEDGVIVATASKAIAHDYPKDLFDVAVIADSLKPETVAALSQLPLQVVEVNFERSTKARSINEALDRLPPIYDYILILDADNIMGDECLERLNDALQSGYKIVQGHRTAKNKNTDFAILDGMSEEINNHIFRAGHRALGLSAALIGSGMAFEYAYYRQMMKGNVEMGGEDREAELRILKDRLIIEYVANANIYDEKVQDAKVFAKQRTRWIAGQFYFFKVHGLEGLKQLFKGNFDHFNKVLQTLIPPRVIMIGLIPILVVLSAIFPFRISAWVWIGLFLLLAFAFLISIPGHFFNKKLIRAFLQIPGAVFHMFLGVLKINKAHQTNFHTPHTTKDINP